MSHSTADAAGIRLVSSSSRAIKSLLGFKPSHQVPKSYSVTTNRFAKQCAQEDLVSELDLIWSLCRAALNYKRKDKQGPNYEDGAGSLTFPDFRFSIRVTQDENHPEEILWQQSIDEIKRFDLMLSHNFNEIFRKGFDYIEADFLESPDINGVIDRIEELSLDGIRLQYPADCNSCEIFFKDHGLTTIVTNQTMQLRTNQIGTAKLLAEKFLQIRDAIHGKQGAKSWSNFLAK